MSDMAVYYSMRNSQLTIFKNVPFGLFLRCFPFYVLNVFSEFLYFAIKHRRFRLYIKAKLEAVKLLPKMLGKRKEIMHNMNVDNKYLYSIMTPLWDKEFFVMKIRKFFS